MSTTVQPILAPSSTWFNNSYGITRSSITEITIADTYTPTSSGYKSWDASASQDGSVTVYVEGTKLTIAGNGYGKVFANADSSYAFSHSTAASAFINATAINGLALLDTSMTTNMQGMFRFLPYVTTLDVGNWDVSNVTTMYLIFGGNSSCFMGLTTLDISKWDTSKVTSMRNMFARCVSLPWVDVTNLDVSACASFVGMFSYCSSLIELDVSNWNTSACNSMNSMFVDCGSLTRLDVGRWDTSMVTDMTCLFANCSSLKTLDVGRWDTSKVTNMDLMFYGDTSLETLDVSNWDVSKVTTFNRMFDNCTSLKTLDVSDWDTSQVTDMSYMFNMGYQSSTQLKELDVSRWDTSSATDMRFMFYGCTSLGSIDVSNWDVSKVTNFNHMFAHSHLNIGDISGWTTPAATLMNGIFHTVQNTLLDVTNLVTKNVTTFVQMFENCNKLTEIVGLENFDTSNGFEFTEMFQNCSSLKGLNLSSFDTTKAKDGVRSCENDDGTALLNMFNNMHSLEKITLGPNFSFNGDGTTTSNMAVLPTPASGYWYNRIRTPYASADIPNRTSMTYYSSLDAINNIIYCIKNGTLLDLADAVRSKMGTSDKLSISDMISGIKAPPSIEKLQSTYDFAYYSSMNAAVTAVNDGTSNADATKETAVAGVYTDKDGGKNVVLLKDSTESTRLSPSVDMTINLGGHVLSVSEDVIAINVSSKNVVLDGRLAGSVVCTDNLLDNARAVQITSGNSVTIYGGKYIATCPTGKAITIFVSSDATANVYDSSIESNSSTGTAQGVQNKGTALLSYCKIYAISLASDTVGVDNLGVATISNCAVKAYSNYLEDGSRSAGITNNTHRILTLNNCYVMGMNSGVTNSGTLYVNSGIYESYGHGGFYFAGAGTTSYVRNATIRDCDMPDGYTDMGGGRNGAGFYIGGASGNDNISVYMDNCNVYGINKDQAIVLRGSSGEQNNSLYISNSTIPEGYKIRIDNDTHKLYIGKGNNFTAEDTNRPSAVVVTDEVYVNESAA